MTKEQLLLIRQCLEMTQQELADAIGVSQPTVARWETGVAPIPGMAKNLILTMIDQTTIKKVLAS